MADAVNVRAGDLPWSPPRMLNFDVAHMDTGRGQVVIVRAGRRGTRRVVPPAGDEHAFTVQEWARKVEVSVSPGGRSVRVFVDDVEIDDRLLAALREAAPDTTRKPPP